MSSSAVDVSVLVPVRNEELVLEQTAGRMLDQQFEGTMEFLLIDGCSTDRTREILNRLAEQDSRIRVLENPRESVPAALNVGLESARGRYVVRMDAHTWYPPDYVANGIRRLDAGDVGWVTGPAIPSGTEPVSRAVAAALGVSLGRGGSRKWSPDAAAETELDTGVFGGVWRRDTLAQLGGWEEAWSVNEDAEMAGRVLAGGGRIVCVPAMSARYLPRDSFAGLARQYWRFGYFRVKTSRRHPVALRRSHVAAAGLALGPPAALLAPRPVRRLARVGLAAYAGVLVRAAIVADRAGGAQDRILVATALGVMHFSWGTGFLCGCGRFGLPVEATSRVFGWRRTKP